MRVWRRLADNLDEYTSPASGPVEAVRHHLGAFVIIARTRALPAVALLVALAAGTAAALADTPATLWLRVGHSVILNSQDLRRVTVANSKVAVVVPVGTSQLIVNGKAPGKTTIIVWTARRRTDYGVTITN
jgi:Flp pilus assembly secretin CpaC